MKLSVQYPERAVPADALALARAADRFGYDTIWVAEAYGYDSLTILGALATETRRIKLGTGVVNVFSRTPTLIAQSAATLDALSGGRAVLGLGTSGRGVVTGWHGVSFQQPIRRLREVTEIVRMVLRGERLRYDGDVFEITGGIRLLEQPLRPDLPIYHGSISPKAVELAGELADGWMPVFLSLRRLSGHFLPRLSTGATSVGRKLADCKVCAFGVPLWPGGDRAAALDTERRRIAFYLGAMGTSTTNYYRDLFTSYGFGDEVEAVHAQFRRGERGLAAAAVTDAMVDEVAIVGTPASCRARLEDYARAGVDEIVLRLPEGDIDATIATLAQFAPL